MMPSPSFLATWPPISSTAAEAASRKTADEIAPVLGVEFRGDARRPDEVAEHHGEVAALRGVLRRWGSGLRRLGRWILLGRLARGKLPDRPQNLQTMPERDAEVLQMLVLEFRQNVGVDFALAKNRLVLPEPEAPQPFPDVHG